MSMNFTRVVEMRSDMIEVDGEIFDPIEINGMSDYKFYNGDNLVCPHAFEVYLRDGRRVTITAETPEKLEARRTFILNRTNWVLDMFEDEEDDWS